MIFSDDDVRDFQRDYSVLTTDEIRRVMWKVERRHAESPLKNPRAYMEAALAELQSNRATTTFSEAKTTEPRARGTFRDDGSWNPEANAPSPTEHALREFASTVSRLKLSPAESVDVLKSLPLAAACFRAHDIAIMDRLDAAPVPGSPGHDLGPLPWLEAAWAAVTTSSSGSEFVKRQILYGLKSAALAPLPPRYDLAESWA